MLDASYLPDFLEYLGSEHSNMPVKHGIIGHARDLETVDMATYRNKVVETYKAGTFRMGFLDNISLVGTVAEETGGYIPDVLDMLQESPFLRLVSQIFHRLAHTLVLSQRCSPGFQYISITLLLLFNNKAISM